MITDCPGNFTAANMSSDQVTLDSLMRTKRELDCIKQQTDINAALSNVILMPYPRRPRKTHKNKRIAKKWRKRFGTVEYEPKEAGQVFIMGATQYTTPCIVAYPKTYADLMQKLREMETVTNEFVTTQRSG